MRSIYEIKAHKELQRQHYRVDYKARPFRVPKGYNVDYFGLYDMLALDGKQNLHLIAVKGHQGVPSSLRKQIAGFTINKIVKEIWTYKSNGQIKKEIIL